MKPDSLQLLVPALCVRTHDPPLCGASATERRASHRAFPRRAWEREKAAWFVAAVWGLMTASAFWLVVRCALTSPIADELRYVGVITGAEPLTWQWLFQIENQHCAPVFKLAYLGLGRAAGFDFRAGAFVNVALLAALAMAMIVAAARVRGRTSATDVIFPILLLHWGHGGNLIWGFQLFYVLPTVLAGIVLLVAATSGPRLSLGAAALVAGCLLAAGLSGGPGVFYVPPLAAWLGYAGLVRWRDFPADVPHLAAQAERNCTLLCANRRAGVAMVFMGAAACLPLAAYAIARSESLRFPSALAPTSQGPLAGTLAFFGLGVGKIGKELWPVSGLVVVGLMAMGTCALYRRWRSQPRERLAASGLSLFLCGAALLAIGTGVARGHMAPNACLQYRYMILAAPLMLCLYWIGVRYGSPITDRRLRVGLTVGMLVLAGWYNARGWNLAMGMREPVVELEKAVAAGMAPRDAAIHFAGVLQDPVDSLRAHLEMLHSAGLGPYRHSP
jgi:hypothetical protein